MPKIFNTYTSFFLKRVRTASIINSSDFKRLNRGSRGLQLNTVQKTLLSSLKGVQPKIYADADLNKQCLDERIDRIGTIGSTSRDTKPKTCSEECRSPSLVSQQGLLLRSDYNTRLHLPQQIPPIPTGVQVTGHHICSIVGETKIHGEAARVIKRFP